MKLIRKIFTVMTILIFSYCATAPKPVDTFAMRNKPPYERGQIYSQNAILPGGFFTPFKIGDTGYNAEELSPLFDAPYTGPQAKDTYATANTWNLCASVFGAIGGGLLGWNAGTALGGGKAENGLWIGGGVSLGVAITFGIIASGKYADAAKLYNDDLMRALDLNVKTSAVKPQEQFAHYSLGLTQSF
jgi:hypothetical protein